MGLLKTFERLVFICFWTWPRIIRGNYCSLQCGLRPLLVELPARGDRSTSGVSRWSLSTSCAWAFRKAPWCWSTLSRLALSVISQPSVQEDVSHASDDSSREVGIVARLEPFSAILRKRRRAASTAAPPPPPPPLRAGKCCACGLRES
ncbi:hypothetical protein JYU34_009202 [Plutella xylostella]|uniref:Uncharacterized protein n=1 Tax=Plutella xylostella TaxID=51655 RepID=A0ABQ7QIU8_PLUXY|nr:hypothetical protein JYU34_009202 [Plutella xylostella]